MLTLFCFFACIFANSCGDITKFRSDEIISGFKPELLFGFFYEQAYSDIAQVGSSCQTLNVSMPSSDGAIDMDFSVKYGIIPFTIVEHYTVMNASIRGYYKKNAKMPGGQLLTLPTVVVSAKGGSSIGYDSMILYSCLNVVASKVEEVVIATKKKIISDEELKSLIQIVMDKIPSFDVSDLKMVGQDKC